MKEFEEGERYARPHLVSSRRIQAASKKLQVSSDLLVAPTVADCHLVNAGGMYNTEPFVASHGQRAPHTAVVQVYYEANVLQRGPYEMRTVPFLL